MPCLVNRFVWSIDEIAVITKNAWALKSHGDTLAKNDRQRVRKCLLSRLQGKAEAEILRDLAFESQEEYYKWQVSRAIDIDHRRLSDPFDNWLKACSYFELDPNLEALEECQGHQPESSDGHKVDVPEANADLGARGNQAQITALEACEFRHSPDFRSVVATSGKSFVLTAKQAHMVQILHSAWLNGTPELSQGHLIEEVFGEVAENRLKRLFAYDEAWSQLFESGSRKGLIRLKVLPSETQS